MSRLSAIVTAALALGSISQAHATVSTYFDPAAFAAAAGATVTETFTGAATGFYSSNYAVNYGGFTVSGATNGNRVGISNDSVAQGGDNFPVPASFSGQNYFGIGQTTGSVSNTVGDITFTFASGVTAIAFNWFNTDNSDSYGVRLVTGETYTAPPFTTATDGAISGFFGMISTTAMPSFTVFNVQASGYISTEGLDNLIYSASSVPVPEPASLALLGATVAGMALSRRRRS